MITQLKQGQLYRDTQDVLAEGKTVLRFVGYEPDGTLCFEFVSGEECYIADNDGYIKFSFNKYFYEE